MSDAGVCSDSDRFGCSIRGGSPLASQAGGLESLSLPCAISLSHWLWVSICSRIQSSCSLRSDEIGAGGDCIRMVDLAVNQTYVASEARMSTVPSQGS